MSLGKLLADEEMWVCDVCESTVCSTKPHVRTTWKWEIREFPAGGRLCLCEDCAAKYARLRKQGATG